MNPEDQNQEKNKLHYEALYANYPISNILHWINNLDSFLDSATTTETSWFGLYQNNFREKIKGKKVLEMGCGDCTNAAVMAALGAEVYANDIASASGEIVRKLNENYNFKYPIKFVEGDFLNNRLTSQSFDFIIGKAFLHHLTIPKEQLFLKETARLLKLDGEARFFEPAVNNKVLDQIRWLIPVKNRPSKLQLKAFKKWKEEDPHPDRTYGSRHFEKAGEELFQRIQIIPVGTLERFNKFVTRKTLNIRFRRWALKNEKRIPDPLNLALTRSQLIIYTNPRLEINI